MNPHIWAPEAIFLTTAHTDFLRRVLLLLSGKWIGGGGRGHMGTPMRKPLGGSGESYRLCLLLGAAVGLYLPCPELDFCVGYTLLQTVR